MRLKNPVKTQGAPVTQPPGTARSLQIRSRSTFLTKLRFDQRFLSVLAPHLAVSKEVLAKSVLRPLKTGSVYPETYGDGYRFWKQDVAQGKVVICTKSIADLSKALDSPAYKLWRVALKVQNGVQTVSKAQQVLDNADAAGKQSGVTDVAARATAREELADEKDVVRTAFKTYKKLGGKAATPSEVVPGPDPAADYR